MTDEELKRRLAIAFTDKWSIEKRQNLIINNTDEELPSLSLEAAQDTLEWLNRGYDRGLIWYNDEQFPIFDSDFRFLPYVLLYRGSKISMRRKISIVGTRHSTYDALQRSFVLGFEAGLAGFDVVSGLAEGVDQASARGVMSCLNINADTGSAVAVLGCGPDIDYPAASVRLKHKIIDNGGCIISPFSPFCPPLKQNFPKRNVIIAAMGEKCIVVQAPQKSGSLITADFAMQMGKDVYVCTEGVCSSYSSKGSNDLFYAGAQVCDHIREIEPSFCSEAVKSTDYGKWFVRYGSERYILKQADGI